VWCVSFEFIHKEHGSHSACEDAGWYKEVLRSTGIVTIMSHRSGPCWYAQNQITSPRPSLVADATEHCKPTALPRTDDHLKSRCL
jgi:hypothetical protein